MYPKINNSRRLSHDVAAHIKTLIRSEKLKPGAKLPNETQLAELFGVSRPTVREAMKALVSQNIIEIVRGRGTFVSQTPGISSDPLGLDFVADRNLPLSLIEARQIIEPSSASLAAERATPHNLEKLAGFVREMEAAINRNQAWMEAEVAFHRGIAQATDNPVIMRILPVILEAIEKTFQYAPRTSKDHRQAHVEHSNILKAIREHNPDHAFEAMRRHLDASYHRTLAIGMKKKPQRQSSVKS